MEWLSQKRNKPSAGQRVRIEFDKSIRGTVDFHRELKECMQCKYFWGHNHNCELKKCYKDKSEPRKQNVSKCEGCCYRNDGICFPCIKDLLGK